MISPGRLSGESGTRHELLLAVPVAAVARLALARACAWGLLVAGWIGLGTFALRGAASAMWGFGVVALWLLALGASASVSAALAGAATTTGGSSSLARWRTSLRGAALIACAALTCASLIALVRGGGLAALLGAVAGWAVLTALASGVVRSVRLAQPVRPGPPLAAATLGAMAAGLALGDLGAPDALAFRLAAFVAIAAVVLLVLQRGAPVPRGGCRAGLFDCSLPAWPAGAWHDVRQWPTLLAGLAMLPMMAALPLMADWCRSQAIAPAAVVLLHLVAMFVPALLLRQAIARWSLRTLSSVCVALLVGGAVLAWTMPSPVNLLALAGLHGAAWGLAWGGQLWAPTRRARQGTSPLRAALGYAALTFAFGAVVDRIGAAGVIDFHAALAVVALVAWLAAALRRRPTISQH